MLCRISVYSGTPVAFLKYYIMMRYLIASKNKIHYLCGDGTEKSVPRDHHLSPLNKPCDAKRCAWDGFFYPTLTLMINCYTLGNKFSNTANTIRIQIDHNMKNINTTVKPVLSSHLKRTSKIGFKTDYHLMQVKTTAECSSILQYFLPSLRLSYHLSLRPLFCLFLSGRLRQVYCISIHLENNCWKFLVCVAL